MHSDFCYDNKLRCSGKFVEPQTLNVSLACKLLAQQASAILNKDNCGCWKVLELLQSILLFTWPIRYYVTTRLREKIRH